VTQFTDLHTQVFGGFSDESALCALQVAQLATVKGGGGGGGSKEEMSEMGWEWSQMVCCCVLQCVAVCCSVLRVAVCCCVLLCVSVCCSVLLYVVG